MSESLRICGSAAIFFAEPSTLNMVGGQDEAGGLQFERCRVRMDSTEVRTFTGDARGVLELWAYQIQIVEANDSAKF